MMVSHGRRQGANLTRRFLLELGALVALTDWGFKVGESSLLKRVPGIDVPVLPSWR